MFALLSLSGDIGCAGGPTVVGEITGMFGDSFTMGLSVATVFPIMLIVFAFICMKMTGSKGEAKEKVNQN